MAVQAALTGHLVFSTVHTNDAPSAITRLLELGVPSFLLNATLLGILAQRLVRLLCPHCKSAGGTVDPELWADLIAPWKSERPVEIYKPVGCLECRMTGYRGRSGIYELLEMSGEIKKLVVSEPTIDPIRNQSIREGMRTLRVSGAMKIAAGSTTVEEVLKVAPRLNE